MINITPTKQVKKDMTLTECKILDLPTFEDNRGSLTLIDSDTASEYLPFVPKRCFWIHSMAKNKSRGEHAHRTCWEVVVPIHGSFNLTLNDGFRTKNIFADNPRKGLVIPPMIWCRLWNFTPQAVCLVFASENYNKAGYINDFMSFVKEVMK